MNNTTPRIILFDGVCNFCSASVRFVIKRDSKQLFKFCSLQSAIGKRLLTQTDLRSDLQPNDLQKNTLSSMILLESHRAFTKSSAALTVAKHLDWPWPLLYAFMIVPKSLRDAVYDFIGNRRYHWFGKRDSCWIAPEAHKNRFLDFDNLRGK